MKENVLQVQKYLNKQAPPAGIVEDGLWGPQTQYAYDQMRQRKLLAIKGKFPWPNQDEISMTNFYGPHGREGGYTPPQALVELPMKFYLYGEKDQVLRQIRVHEKIAPAYERVVDRIWQFYNEDQAELDQTGWTNYDGCYNPRPITNGSIWSNHAWAAASDHDADRNPWGKGRQMSWMPEEIIDLYETEGAVNLGRYRNTDYQHFAWIQPF